MTNPNTLGQKIREFRKRAKMSQMDLELAIETSPGSISRIENGVVNPTKETLFSIIDSLKLNVEESSDLFNIDLSKKVFELSNISKELSDAKTERQLLDHVTHKLVTKLNVNYATGWLFDEKKKLLRLESISIPDKAFNFILNVLKLSVNKIYFDAAEETHKSNFILMSILENQVTMTSNFYEFAQPLAGKKASIVLSRMINMELGIHIPLLCKNTKIGVLGFIWPEKSISKTRLEEFKFIADLIASEIYHMRIINDLRKIV